MIVTPFFAIIVSYYKFDEDSTVRNTSTWKLGRRVGDSLFQMFLKSALCFLLLLPYLNPNFQPIFLDLVEHPRNLPV